MSAASHAVMATQPGWLFRTRIGEGFLTKKNLGNSLNYTEMPTGNVDIKRRCVIFATKSSAASCLV